MNGKLNKGKFINIAQFNSKVTKANVLCTNSYMHTTLIIETNYHMQ